MSHRFVRSLCIVWALAAAVPSLCAAGGFSAEPCGYAGGGRFTAVAVSPHDPQIVLAGSDVAGVFKSSDGGGHFTPKGKGLEGFSVAAIEFNPDDRHNAYLLTDDGLYGSRDNAESWYKISSDIFYKQRFSGSHAMLFSDNALWVATDQRGVFTVDCRGAQARVRAMPGLEQTKVNSLAPYQAAMHAVTARGVFRYRDGSWSMVNQGLPAGGTDITDIAAQAGGRLYIVEKSTGLYVWDDVLGQWTARPVPTGAGPLNARTTYKMLAVHPADEGRVFLATHPDSWPFLLFASASGGSAWERHGRFSMPASSPVSWRTPPDAIEAIAFSRGNPDQMFLADWWNLWRSSDGGKNWAAVTGGLQNFVVNDIKVHPQKDTTLFMAVADNGLVMTDDACATWRRIMTGVQDGHAQELEISRRDPQKMYLLLNPWTRQDRVCVYKTLDGGAHWQDVGFSIAGLQRQKLPFVDGLPTNLELDPSSDDMVYVGTNGYGVFKTSNGGKDWEAASSGLATPFIKGPDALLAHPGKPQTLFASTLSGGIYKSTDGAKTWTATGPAGAFVFGMAVDPFNPSRIMAACAEKKLLLSENEGITWRELRLPGKSPPHISACAVVFHPGRQGALYAGTLAYDCKAADGLFASHDGGRTFESMALDVPQVSINDLCVSAGARPALYAGFNGTGLYRVDASR